MPARQDSALNGHYRIAEIGIPPASSPAGGRLPPALHLPLPPKELVGSNGGQAAAEVFPQILPTRRYASLEILLRNFPLRIRCSRSILTRSRVLSLIAPVAIIS